MATVRILYRIRWIIFQSLFALSKKIQITLSKVQNYWGIIRSS